MGRFSTIFQIVIFLSGCQNHAIPNDLETELGNWKKFEERMHNYTVDQQDLLRLQLAVRHPKHSQYLCQKVQSKMAIDKCRQVIGRPHLQMVR